jgi:hypothetical protein
VKRYLKNTQENPKTPYADPKGSWMKSQECDCRYCFLACQVINQDGDGDVRVNEDSNRRAIKKDSQLSHPNTSLAAKDFLEAEFRGSGLAFERNKAGKEVFVVDSKPRTRRYTGNRC